MNHDSETNNPFDALEKRLRNRTPPAELAPSPAHHQRVLAAVERELRQESQAASRWLLECAALAAALLLAAGLSLASASRDAWRSPIAGVALARVTASELRAVLPELSEADAAALAATPRGGCVTPVLALGGQRR